MVKKIIWFPWISWDFCDFLGNPMIAFQFLWFPAISSDFLRFLGLSNFMYIQISKNKKLSVRMISWSNIYLITGFCHIKCSEMSSNWGLRKKTYITFVLRYWLLIFVYFSSFNQGHFLSDTLDISWQNTCLSSFWSS